MFRAILFRDCKQTIRSVGIIICLSLYMVIGCGVELAAVAISRYSIFMMLYLCAVWSFGIAGGLTELIKYDKNSGIFSLLHQIDGGFVKYYFAKMLLPTILMAIECAVMWVIYIPYGLKNGLRFQDIALSVIVAECMTISVTSLSLLVISWSGEKLLPVLSVAELVILTVIVAVAVFSVFAAVALTLVFACGVLVPLALYVRGHYVCTLK